MRCRAALTTREAWVLPVDAHIAAAPGGESLLDTIYETRWTHRLLDILVCPICAANLEYRKAASELVCALKTRLPGARRHSGDAPGRGPPTGGGRTRMPADDIRFKAVIPARYAHRRVCRPAPLLDLGGKPMVARTWPSARRFPAPRNWVLVESTITRCRRRPRARLVGAADAQRSSERDRSSG